MLSREISLKNLRIFNKWLKNEQSGHFPNFVQNDTIDLGKFTEDAVPPHLPRPPPLPLI
jgi:hypothetical protein